VLPETQQANITLPKFLLDNVEYYRYELCSPSIDPGDTPCVDGAAVLPKPTIIFPQLSSIELSADCINSDRKPLNKNLIIWGIEYPMKNKS
jgi:hypothetical protein